MAVSFTYKNNSGEAVDLSPSSIGLVGKSGRRFEVIPDLARYVPTERDPFARPVEPGATVEGRAIFAVTPKPPASGSNWGRATVPPGECLREPRFVRAAYVGALCAAVSRRRAMFFGGTTEGRGTNPRPSVCA